MIISLIISTNFFSGHAKIYSKQSCFFDSKYYLFFTIKRKNIKILILVMIPIIIETLRLYKLILNISIEFNDSKT